jgi:hypothetical protein
MESPESSQKEVSSNSEESQTEWLRRKQNIKAILKEEDPQRLGRVIDRIESSQEIIDTYIARITGVKTKIITTTRNWNRIIKKIIIEEGREALELALSELEQELIIAANLKKNELRF